MLTDYIDAAMHRAAYTWLDESQEFFGTIPGLQGVWANAPTLEACREELKEVLEEWIALRLSRGFDLPDIGTEAIRMAAIG